jgi:hypothetical protein
MFSLSPRVRRATLLLALLSSTSAIPACVINHGCSNSWCGTSATLRLTVPTTGSTAFPLKVTTCRNTDCRTADIASPPVGVDNPTSFADLPAQTAPAPATPPISAAAWLSPRAAGGVSLEVRWSVWDQTLVQNGDRYTVTVTDANGAPQATLDKMATYGNTYPNGEDCGPTCKVVTLASSP